MEALRSYKASGNANQRRDVTFQNILTLRFEIIPAVDDHDITEVLFTNRCIKELL